MTFEKYYSSSRGNLYTVTATNGNRLLIECGVTWKRLEKALKFNLQGIEVCLLSHEHKDHSKAVEDVLKAGIRVLASPGTLNAIEESLHLHRHVIVVGNVVDKVIWCFESFKVFCFPIHHDAAQPLGFVIHEKETGECLLFATDTSHITQRFSIPFDIIAIEASYDKEILQERVDKGDINEEVAKRLLNSHQEWRVALRYLKDFCNLSKCRQVFLLHPSGENLNKKAVRDGIYSETFVKTIIC